MEIKYSTEIDDKAIEYNLKRLINQVYKLLPTREEAIDWQKPLETIIEELTGMSSLLVDQQVSFFSLLCKLEGLFSLGADEDFPLFRRTIFECLSLMNTIKNNLLSYVARNTE